MSATGAAAPGLLEWDPAAARLVPAGTSHAEPDVVDSWLVQDGWARAIELHAARFTQACRSRHALPAERSAPFLASGLRAIPSAGRWFPRVELTADPLRLWLRLRPAPPRSPVARLWLSDRADARRAPRIKGPDLAAMHRLRARAQHAGADEALLLGPDGTVREGAFSAILWWRADTLCATSPLAPVLASVTKGLLLELAAGAGHDVSFEAVGPAELAGLEVWSVSALHGIRAVTGWAGQPFEPAAAARAEAWNRRLREALRPLRP